MIILGDAAVELSARGIMISWRALLHFLLFLLPLLLWVWRTRRAGPRLVEGLEESEAQTEEGGDALAEVLERRRERVPSDGRTYEAWTIPQLRGELTARQLPARGRVPKSELIDRLRQADREADRAERAACAACREVERVVIHGGFASCERHRCGASGPVRVEPSPAAGTGSAPPPSAPPAAQALDDGLGRHRLPCSGCGEMNPGHSGSRCPNRGAAEREPTAAQVAYVEVLCERFSMPRPPLEQWTRLRVSRWIAQHEAGPGPAVA